MAVYTDVTDDALADFLADYDIGTMVAFRGMAEGVENSNYSLRTTGGDFILTLYEKRVDPDDLPWFLGLMEHLAQHGLVCPQPVRGRDGSGAAASVREARRDHHFPARRLAAPCPPGALRTGRHCLGDAASGGGRLRPETRQCARSGKLAPAARSLPRPCRRRPARAGHSNWMTP